MAPPSVRRTPVRHVSQCTAAAIAWVSFHRHWALRLLLLLLPLLHILRSLEPVAVFRQYPLLSLLLL
jgi:hypothetical protein